MPEELKELIKKYKDKKFTIDLYDKYKIYKSNSKFIQTNV
jgi:hypothetical protein